MGRWWERHAWAGAWTSAALAATMVIAALVLARLAGTTLGLGDVVSVVSIPVFICLGLLISLRQPRNPIGWLFGAIALAGGLFVLSLSYTELWLAGKVETEFLGRTAATYANASWILYVVPTCTLVLLLFPDGLPSRRWRWVGWCAVLGMAATLISEMTAPGPLDDYPQVVNPFGSKGLSEALGFGFLMVIAAILGSGASLVVRFRRSRGRERQQIKVLALGGSVAAAVIAGAASLYGTLGDGVAGTAILLAIMVPPLAAGFAILRHQLFDIDVVINRTLVYGGLTATLALAYLALIVVLQLVVSPLTENSDLAVAASTLAVAGLARPARVRIQRLVDRRFFRSRYDAAQTLEQFGGLLRDQLELEALRTDLLGVVGRTMQPAHVSLWMRDETADRAGAGSLGRAVQR